MLKGLLDQIGLFLMKQKILKIPLLASENNQLWLVNCVIDDDTLSANFAYIGSFSNQIEEVKGDGRSFKILLPNNLQNHATYVRAVNANFEILD